MKKSLSKIVLAVVIAGLLTGGAAIVSAATKVRTVTTAQGTTVDVVSITGKVTEVSDAAASGTDQSIRGMFRRGRDYATITDDADGKVYTIELGRGESAGISMKVGDTVTVEGTISTHGTENELQIWTFTGADGKTVTLRKDDGTPNIETVTVAGTVSEVSQQTGTAPSAGDTSRPASRAMDTIKVNQADGTVVTVVLGHGASSVTVKVGDTVTVTGFKTPMSSGTIMATTFTGADGKTVTLRGIEGMQDDRPAGESVTVTGTVSKVVLPQTENTDRPVPGAGMETIDIKQADGTSVTVVLGHDTSSVTVKVGDTVTVTGFKTPMSSGTIMATTFTGADGKTVTLQHMGGMRGGRGFGEGGHGPGDDCPPTAPAGSGI